MTFNKSIWKHGNYTYDIIGIKANKVIIHCTNRYGIYYTDVKVTTITRNLSKAKTIRLGGVVHDLSKVEGI